MVLTESVDEILKCDHSTVKASDHEQYISLVLYIMLYKVVLCGVAVHGLVVSALDF